MIRHLGMALGILRAQESPVEALITGREAVDDAFQVEKAKPVIERAHDTTLDLLEKMNARAKRLMVEIDTKREELRQVEAVIKGASAMLDHVEAAMDGLETEIALSGADRVHDALVKAALQGGLNQSPPVPKDD
jgi:paraquat-inducible protein B